MGNTNEAKKGYDFLAELFRMSKNFLYGFGMQFFLRLYSTKPKVYGFIFNVLFWNCPYSNSIINSLQFRDQSFNCQE